MSRTSLSLSVLCGLALLSTSCAALRSLAGRNSVSLESAEVVAMSVDVRKSEKTLCPREPVQMAVFADARLKGEQNVAKLETWQGDAGANRNGKLEFDEFAFHSEQGNFDDIGWFTPNRDLLKTVGKEFEITTAYRRRPDKFTFKTSYKPDYRCIREAGGPAALGRGGNSGPDGTPGQSGSTGSSTSAGTAGSSGRPGGSGGDGSDGGPGPRLAIYATYVKTPFYDRLIAVLVEGEHRDFLLAHPEGQLILLARGGDGGPGGSGGRGGEGGRGGGGNPAGNGGDGAAGGNGGNGGRGGPGGSIELIVDERFADLAQRLEADVSGGRGGVGGGYGSGGRPGSGGSGMNGSQSGSDGAEGAAGQQGSSGTAGARGSVTSRTGSVAERFAGLEGVTVL